MKSKRVEIIDIMRFMAIFLMIIFHFSYDLTLFKIIEIDFQKDFFWWLLPRIIVTLFFLPMGMSFYLTYRNKIHINKLVYRFMKLFLFALIISGVTYKLYPDQWIYYGTLHSIAVASLVLVPFVKIPKLSFWIGLIGLFFEFVIKVDWHWWKLPHQSMDYIPTLPWVFVALIGIGLMGYFYEKIKLISIIGEGKTKKIIEFCSTHSLKIYLVHQPILFSLSWIISLTNS